MSVIFIDRLSHVAVLNGVLRVECMEVGANGQERPSGSLFIAGNQAGPVLQSLLNAVQELEKRMREQQAQQAPTAGNA